MLLNKSNLNTINVAINEAFSQGMGEYPERDLYQELVYETISTSKTEEYNWVSDVPRVREWIGDRHIGNLSKMGFQVTNKKFESTVHLLRDEIEDDTWLKSVPVATVMGEEVPRYRNEMVFNLLASGNTTLGYDGQTFFNANHPVTNAAGATVVQSNLQAGAGTPWYLMDLSSKVMRPIIFQKRREFGLRFMGDEHDEQVFMRDEFRWGVDGRCGAGLAFWQKALRSGAPLNTANFDAAKVQMAQLTREGGGMAGIKPTHLVCGPSNMAAAQQLLQTQLVAQAVGTGGAAVSNYNFGAVKLIVSSYLP